MKTYYIGTLLVTEYTWEEFKKIKLEKWKKGKN